MSKLNKFSESEDDPDPFESSGDEWKEELESKKNTRRTSTRLSTKPRKVHHDTSTDSDDSSLGEKSSKKSKNGVTKKPKLSHSPDTIKVDSESGPEPEPEIKKEENANNGERPNVTVVSNTSSRPIHRKFIPKTITCVDYSTGSFVINKKDVQKGDTGTQPCIWRIDGKALLQKYEPIEQEGKVRHKNTSVYTGWSPMDKDIYAPITVDVIEHNNHNLTVEIHWDDLKKINYDSD